MAKHSTQKPDEHQTPKEHLVVQKEQQQSPLEQQDPPDEKQPEAPKENLYGPFIVLRSYHHEGGKTYGPEDPPFMSKSDLLKFNSQGAEKFALAVRKPLQPTTKTTRSEEDE